MENLVCKGRADLNTEEAGTALQHSINPDQRAAYSHF